MKALVPTPTVVDLLNTPVPDGTPELVSLSDAARRVGVTQQAMSKHYAKRDENGFPSPIGRVGQALVFRLDDVVEWWDARPRRRTRPK